MNAWMKWLLAFIVLIILGAVLGYTLNSTDDKK